MGIARVRRVSAVVRFGSGMMGMLVVVIMMMVVMVVRRTGMSVAAMLFSDHLPSGFSRTDHHPGEINIQHLLPTFSRFVENQAFTRVSPVVCSFVLFHEV